MKPRLSRAVSKEDMLNVFNEDLSTVFNARDKKPSVIKKRGVPNVSRSPSKAADFFDKLIENTTKLPMPTDVTSSPIAVETSEEEDEIDMNFI